MNVSVKGWMIQRKSPRTRALCNDLKEAVSVVCQSLVHGTGSRTQEIITSSLMIPVVW